MHVTIPKDRVHRVQLPWDLTAPPTQWEAVAQLMWPQGSRNTSSPNTIKTSNIPLQAVQLDSRTAAPGTTRRRASEVSLTCCGTRMRKSSLISTLSIRGCIAITRMQVRVVWAEAWAPLKEEPRQMAHLPPVAVLLASVPRTRNPSPAAARPCKRKSYKTTFSFNRLHLATAPTF